MHFGVFDVLNKVLFQRLTGDSFKKTLFFCRFLRFFAFAFKSRIFLCWPFLFLVLNFCVFFCFVFFVVVVGQIWLLCSGFCFCCFGFPCFFCGMCSFFVCFWFVLFFC